MTIPEVEFSERCQNGSALRHLVALELFFIYYVVPQMTIGLGSDEIKPLKEAISSEYLKLEDLKLYFSHS